MQYGAELKSRWGFRWWICGLLFLAATVNYIDRQVIGVLKPTLQHELGWSEIDYGNIVFWFQVAYAAGYLFAGRLMDVVGVRLGYALAVTLWSAAAVAHAFVRSVGGFSAARFALGLAEGGNFPAAVKTVSEWFPKKERAFATGLFNSGTNIGAIITPLVVPWITLHYGWQAAFIVTGSLGIFWLILWLPLYRHPDRHRLVSRAELDYIRSDPPDPVVKIPWLKLLAYRPTWAFIVGFVLSGPIWWFYLYWVPGFLYKQHGLNLTTMGPPLVAIYLISDAGSIAGGWLSSTLIKRGFSVNVARKTAMLVCALCVVPVFLAAWTSSLWTATLVIALAAAAHQGWSANLYTLVSDTMPRHAVSSVVGIGGMAGSVAGMFFALLVGHILQWTGNYLILFGIASAAYLLALLIIHLLVPRLQAAEQQPN
ncbi:MFS transporter [Fontivita pretiosa]|uniref:MFS transporter n=1 Tax=Fontivita pretiosa TaxID=2989684 RepID=UPI003D1807B4